jgi:chlorite dismutase
VADAGQEPTQYAAYRFGKIDPAWRRLPVEERAAMKEAYAEVVEEWQGRMQVLSYSLVGVRPDADFFFWVLTERYEDLRDFAADLNATPLAGWLETPYSYLAATLSSKYFERDPKRRARRVVPRKAPYLVVYPFVKLRPWYALSLEDRRRAMQEHAEIGSRFVTITNHTTYSFGIDDQEFMTAFECEEPVDFLHLMMTLRETRRSSSVCSRTRGRCSTPSTARGHGSKPAEPIPGGTGPAPTPPRVPSCRGRTRPAHQLPGGTGPAPTPAAPPSCRSRTCPARCPYRTASSLRSTSGSRSFAASTGTLARIRACARRRSRPEFTATAASTSPPAT